MAAAESKMTTKMRDVGRRSQKKKKTMAKELNGFNFEQRHGKERVRLGRV